jgi:hypothetical protein
MNAQNFINNAVQNWLDTHPTIDWMVDHPLLSIVFGLLIIFLFWGLLNAIARFTERFWIALLRSPLQLSQWIFSGSSYLLTGALRMKPKEDPKAQLAEVLGRLEELRKEEDKLLEKVKELMAAK